jgi:hypothetical protein
LTPRFVRCVDAKRKDKAPAYRERRGATGGGLMELYSEANRAATEKNPFPHTPAQHALLLHPLKAQGQATVARILPEPVS